LKNICFLGIGYLAVGLAFIGIFVPGLPTTPFLLVALWAFSRGSDKMRDWLLNHPRFGPTLRAWKDHQVIPVKAKIASGTLMSLSVLICFLTADNIFWPFILLGICALVFAYIVTRPSFPIAATVAEISSSAPKDPS
jgi:hypothetical protein